ncbi:MAG: PH domain-containing protein [Alphaproteobacteria bacterium]|nr:PH domain-containing protein [Alphaproteobacteria bacterium]
MYYNGNYIKRTLSYDEDVLFFIQQHGIVWLETCFWGLVSIVPLALMIVFRLPYQNLFFLMFGLLFLVTLYKYFMVAVIEMALTNKRVIRRTGVIWVKSEELLLQKVESVEIAQSIMGRILGYGNIIFSGTGTSKVNLKNVRDPVEVKRDIEYYFGSALEVHQE